MKSMMNNDESVSLASKIEIFIGRTRIAFRNLRKNPLITISAIISIALGIGTATAMFSIYDEFLLRRLPVPEPEKLVNFTSPGPRPGNMSTNVAGSEDNVFSYPMFRDLEKIQQVFTGVAAHRQFSANIATPSDSSHESCLLVSGSYFSVLGIQPVLGRLLNSNDDSIIGEGRVAVLGYDYWQNHLGGDPDILNQSIIVNGRPLTVVGVVPRSFTGTTLGLKPRIFVPITMRDVLQAGSPTLDNRTSYWTYIFGRLKPGITLEQANVAMDVPYRNIINQVDAPEAELLLGRNSSIMDRFRARRLILKPGARGQSNFTGSITKQPLDILMGCTLLLLLIVCANVTGLLLARGMTRSGEMAVRAALGAQRTQITAQLMVESFVLVFVAGIVGVFAGQWILHVILALVPAQEVARFNVTLNGTALLFAAILTSVTGIAIGLFPSVYSTRSDLTSLIKTQAGQSTGSKSTLRVRTVLLIVQIAISMALMVVSGLFAKSLLNINRTNIGMKIEQVASFSISPSSNGYTSLQELQFFERLENELAALPGVTGITSSLIQLISGNTTNVGVVVEGYTTDEQSISNSQYNRAGSNYFQTLGIPLVAGRDFINDDASGLSKVVVVNEAFAEKYQLGRDAVGKRIGINGNTLDYEIIGISKNAKYISVSTEAYPFVVTPFRQSDTGGKRTYYVKTSLPPKSLLPQIRRVTAQLDSTLPLADLSTMTQHVQDETFPSRIMAALTAAFAGMATLLTAVGLYGIFADDVARRRREIGLRMALGATHVRLCLMFLRKAALITLTGGAAGFVIGVFSGRILQSMLYQLESFDTGVFLCAAVMLFLIMLLAVMIPVIRAVRTEPMKALSQE